MKKSEDYCFFNLMSIKAVVISQIFALIVCFGGLIVLILCNPTETKETSGNPPKTTIEKHYAIGFIIYCGIVIGTCILALYGILRVRIVSKKTELMYPYIAATVIFIVAVIAYSGMLVLNENYVSDIGPDIYPLRWVIDRVRDARENVDLYAVILFIQQSLFIALEIYVLFVTFRYRKRIIASSTLQISRVSKY